MVNLKSNRLVKEILKRRFLCRDCGLDGQDGRAGELGRESAEHRPRLQFAEGERELYSITCVT